MKVKTYTFEDIRKGMDVIKEQFGPDTIIMDIKQNNHNGNGWTKKGCEISIAVENDPVATVEMDLGEVRKKTEAIWSDAARYVTERLSSIESDMFTDRLKAYPTPLKIIHDRLIKSGLDRQISLSVVSDVYAEIGLIAENTTKALYFVKSKLGKRVPLCNLLSDEKPTVFVGPTGSGKSETAKKLAVLMQDRDLNPSIIAFDPVRKGTYGEYVNFSEQVGVPFQFAANAGELNRKIQEATGNVIVDITGHMAYQREALAPLPGLRKIAVFPAGARDEAVDQYLSAMRDIPISGLVFTKLDEYDRFGCLMNSILRLERPIAALTGGLQMENIMLPELETFGKIMIEGKIW